MTIASYNINGIRAAIRKGLIDWLKTSQIEVVCLQEIKALEDQVPELDQIKTLGYHICWHAAEKKGYSGVAILSKAKPKAIKYGCGNPVYDIEGRFLQVDFETFSILNVYIPSGSSKKERQRFKITFLDFFGQYCQQLKSQKKNLLVCGDFNICHTDIDIHNPIANKNASGFLPEERQWITNFLALGFVDTFRKFHPEPHQYSWWTYRAGAREKNKGWRIDYCMSSISMADRVLEADILPDVKHSDHCPITVKIE